MEQEEVSYNLTARPTVQRYQQRDGLYFPGIRPIDGLLNICQNPHERNSSILRWLAFHRRTERDGRKRCCDSGGGLAGLAAGCALGDRAVVLERDGRPGGLVKTTCFNGYWFDHVLHSLYFSDSATETRVRALLGGELAWCPPEAWVETLHGTVRFPFQMHLGGLPKDLVVKCVSDLAKVLFKREKRNPSNFEEFLLLTYGQGMCETFLIPYNQKVWKHPLNTLAPSGFLWNITPPEFGNVLKGALDPNGSFEAYNSKGWYPRPAQGSPVRGMEVLSRALASRVPNLRLEHTVERIDLEAQTIYARRQGQLVPFHYRKACCSTLPLPQTLAICRPTSESLQMECESLIHNRVLSVALCLRGPRPEGRGHWRYYADPSLVFNRLIYMHAFDPQSAPQKGWGLLAEITEPAENPLPDEEEISRRVQADAKSAGAIPAGCVVIESHLIVADPAYVVFTAGAQQIVDRARAFLKAHSVMPLGRYGNWEYSSMSQVIRDGFSWGEALNAGRVDEYLASGPGYRSRRALRYCGDVSGAHRGT